MRLINVHTRKFKDFFDAEIPAYAILSHKWGDLEDEVSYADYLNGSKSDSPGYQKIMHFGQVAAESGILWIWVDTCCIDKSSSAELSEAINSMFAWYKASQMCAVYLADVTDPSDVDGFNNSQWFTRCWTLQELIAPQHLIFYSSDWHIIGEKKTQNIAKLVSRTTRIPERILRQPEILHNVSVARRMSWAADRRASRKEDVAYSLLGIFDVNMPLLYGEGHKAFTRLQLHIIEHVDDESLFAWRESSNVAPSALHSLLAASPEKFIECGNIVCVREPERLKSPPIKLTSRGAELFVELLQTHDRSATQPILFIYNLSCRTVHDSSSYLEVKIDVDFARQAMFGTCSVALIRKDKAEAFLRTNASMSFSDLDVMCGQTSYVRPKTIYIRTSISGPDMFPSLFTGPAKSITQGQGFDLHSRKREYQGHNTDRKRAKFDRQIRLPRLELLDARAASRDEQPQ